MSSLYFFCIFIVGASFVLAAIIWIARDNRKNHNMINRAEDEKAELISIIEDAELMVNELNNFSDYILTRIEEKNSAVGSYIEELEGKLGAVREDSDRGADRVGKTTGLEYAASSTPKKPEEVISGIGLDGQGRNSETTAGNDVGKTAEDWQPLRPKVYRVKKQSVRNLAEPPAKMRKVRTEKTQIMSPEKKQDASHMTGIAPVIVFSRKDGDDIVKEHRKHSLKYENRKYLQVLQYAQEGSCESEIAQKLNIGKGEVRLILGLAAKEDVLMPAIVEGS